MDWSRCSGEHAVSSSPRSCPTCLPPTGTWCSCRIGLLARAKRRRAASNRCCVGSGRRRGLRNVGGLLIVLVRGRDWLTAIIDLVALIGDVVAVVIDDRGARSPASRTSADKCRPRGRVPNRAGSPTGGKPSAGMVAHTNRDRRPLVVEVVSHGRPAGSDNAARKIGVVACAIAGRSARPNCQSNFRRRPPSVGKCSCRAAGKSPPRKPLKSPPKRPAEYNDCAAARKPLASPPRKAPRAPR